MNIQATEEGLAIKGDNKAESVFHWCGHGTITLLDSAKIENYMYDEKNAKLPRSAHCHSPWRHFPGTNSGPHTVINCRLSTWREGGKLFRIKPQAVRAVQLTVTPRPGSWERIESDEWARGRLPAASGLDWTGPTGCNYIAGTPWPHSTHIQLMTYTLCLQSPMPADTWLRATRISLKPIFACAQKMFTARNRQKYQTAFTNKNT